MITEINFLILHALGLFNIRYFYSKKIYVQSEWQNICKNSQTLHSIHSAKTAEVYTLT